MNAQVLIVEDNLDTLCIFSQAFQDAGFEVNAVVSASAALLQLEKRIPDVIVLDVHLPGMSGLEILPYIRKRYPNTKVIVASANHSLASEVKTADLFLRKPVDVIKLITIAEEFKTQLL